MRRGADIHPICPSNQRQHAESKRQKSKKQKAKGKKAKSKKQNKPSKLLPSAAVALEGWQSELQAMPSLW